MTVNLSDPAATSPTIQSVDTAANARLAEALANPYGTAPAAAAPAPAAAAPSPAAAAPSALAAAPTAPAPAPTPAPAPAAAPAPTESQIEALIDARLAKLGAQNAGVTPPPTPGPLRAGSTGNTILNPDAAPAPAAPAAPADPNAPAALAPTSPATSTTDPAVTSTPTTDPAIETQQAVPVVDPQALIPLVEADVKAAVGRDAQCQEIITEYKATLAQLKDIQAKAPNLGADLQYYQRRLAEPDLDPITRSEIGETIRGLKELSLEARTLTLQKQQLDAVFSERETAIRRAAWNHHRSAAERQAAAVQASQDEQRYHNELLSVWPGAVQAAATKHGIPAKLIPRFDLLAQEAAVAQLSQGIRVTDVPAFFDRVASDLREMMLEFHREQSAVFGHQANQLVQQSVGTPSTQVAPAPVVAESPKPRSFDPLADVQRAADRRLAELMR